MSAEKLPVIAAIPSYNEEQLLGGLLDRVLEEDYDDVYVIDDSSTDGTLEILYERRKDVKAILGRENVGSGANRNRIIPVLGYSAIIHFIDADVRLDSQENPEKIQEIMAWSDLGFAGGLIRLPNGKMHPWNYGPAFSLPQMVSAWLYSSAFRAGAIAPGIAQSARNVLNNWELMRQWPDTFKAPASQDVYWACEGNLMIPSEVFRKLGGYDPKLRYHEVMELAMRMDQLGLKRRFEPSIEVTHQNREHLRKPYTKDFWGALIQIAGKMGIKGFLTGKADQYLSDS